MKKKKKENDEKLYWVHFTSCSQSNLGSEAAKFCEATGYFWIRRKKDIVRKKKETETICERVVMKCVGDW